MIEIKNLKTYKGPGIYIGRPSALGNPFSLKNYSREEVVAKYRIWLEIRLQKHVTNLTRYMFKSLLIEYKAKGKLILICYCSPLACHGDVIKEFIEREINNGSNI